MWIDQKLTFWLSVLESFVRGPIHIIDSVAKTKLSCNIPNRHYTTVSLETYSIINSLVSQENNFYLRKELFVNGRGIHEKSHHFCRSCLDARNENTI